METIFMGPNDTLPLQIDKVMAFSREYREDAAFRARIDTGARDVLIGRGFDVPSAVDVRVVANDDDTFHFVLPPDPNIDLDDEALSAVAGGKSASSAGSAGTAATASSVPSTASSASSASSAGSAGSVD